MRYHPGKIAAFIALSVALVWLGSSVRADYPKPSLHPISWDLKFEHSKPRRIVVAVPGQTTPTAFWYITYTVTNNSDKEQTFLPEFEILTRDGRVIRSDNNISPRVFDAIKEREKNNALKSALDIAGQLRIGDDQSKEGVSIWVEPDSRMGTFSIYASGLSGEIAQLKDEKGELVKDKDGKPVILRKTLEMTYQIPGDEVYPGEDRVLAKSETWVMR